MRLLMIFLVAALAAGSAPGPAAAQQSTDTVDVMDRIGVKVLEWLPAKGEYREWDAIGGEYTVSSEGTILLPFVGEVATAAKSVAALGNEIADRLQRRLSLPTRPEISLQVLARAPVYVIGGVETPGRIEFAPGLTALEAVASAGGFYRGGGGTLRLERDAINAESDLDVARESAARLKALIARLGAELEGEDAVLPRVDAADAASVSPFVPDEQRLLEVRRQSRESQIESLRSRRALAQDQVKSIAEKATNLARQADLTRKQLGDVNSLVDRGLTSTNRALDLERTLADLEGRLLDLEIARLAAGLEINEAERDETDLLTTFRTEVANALQTANAQLAKVTVEIQRADALLREATVTAPERLMDRAGNLEVGIRFFRTRTVAGATTTIEIGKDDMLKGGDTLQVQLDTDRGQPRDDLASAR